MQYVMALKYFSNRPGPLSLLYDPVEVLSSLSIDDLLPYKKTIWEQ